MPLVTLTLAGLSLLIWIVLTFFRGGFWQLRTFGSDAQKSEERQSWPQVVAVVPARNEAETIERCVKSLASQDYPGKFRIIVVDDQSTDDTGTLAQKAAQSKNKTESAAILKAAELPPGWTGKLWALQLGMDKASALAADYFWFTDADIVHAPDTLRRLIARAESQRLDLASLMVLLQVRTIPERLLIPAFLYFFLMLYPPKWIADPKLRMAGAAGGCIVLKRVALERIGGLAAIRGEVIDDCALARAVKRSGGAIWLGLTRNSISLREYTTFGEIRDLIARTAFTQLKYSSLILLGTLAGILVTYVAPVMLTFHANPVLWRTSLAAWALMTLTYLPTVRFYKLSPLWAPLLPLAAAFYFYSTCLSAVRYWMGRGGQWKGRAQAPTNS